MDSYEITSIDEDKGHTFVVFTIDGQKLEKRLGDAPLNDKDELDDFMHKYIAAYKKGKEIEKQNIHSKVRDIVGKKQDVKNG